MKFKKGDTRINRTGRPEGSTNKVSGQMRDFLANFLTESKEEFEKRCKKLSNRDFVRMYLEAMSYVAPKLKSIEIIDVPDLALFAEMSTEQRLAEIQKLQSLKDGQK
jgi:hypothetical protein